MKKLIAWLLLLTLMVGMFAGCRKTDAGPTEPDVTVSEADIEGITAAIDYLKSFYKDEGSETPVDYERFGIVRIGGVPYTVVWTVDVSEDLIKIVVNDDGTVTIDVNEECEEDTPYVLTATVTDAAGNSVSHSWNHILPKAVDMVAIVKAAYALKPGESLPYESTLRGKITQVKTPYSEEYKNITVIIEVEGAEDMPIECYRLKGEGAEDLQVGDIITVTGTLKNYNGTIEFDAGCVLMAVIPGERVEAPDDMKQIVDEAYKLGANKTLPYEATLTGEIIEIGTPYDSYYGNISVTIVVEGREDKPIVCYRMKGKGCENLKVTDVITVKGYITNYVGDKGYSTVEFTAGCQLLDYKPGAGVYAPTDPAEIMRIAKALGANKKTKFEATLTGVINEVNSPYSSQYGNVSVTMDVNGTNDEIYCYRIKGNGADKIDVGDTITVKGYITNYVGDSGKSTIEFVAGSKLISYKKGVKEELPSYKNNIVDAPVVGTAYKMGLEQKNNAGSPWYYFTGKLANDFYLGTSEDGRKAVDVFIGAVSGGYSLYFKDASGKTQYINIIETTGTDGKLHVNMQIADKATSVYTLDAEKKILTTKIGDTPYCIGTYNNYTTMAARKVSGIEMPAYLLTLEALTGPASMEEAAKKLEKDYPDGYDADKKLPTELKIRDDKFTITWKLETTNEAAVKIKDGVVVETQQEQAVNYKLTATITKVGTTETVDVIFNHTVAPIPKDYVKNPVVGTPYKLGVNIIKKLGLFTGKTAGADYKLEIIDDSTKAVDVYLEEVSGGLRLYFKNADGVKTYIEATEYLNSSGKMSGSLKLTTEPTAVYTYDKTLNTLVRKMGENSYYLGSYSKDGVTNEYIGGSSTYYVTGDNAANLDVTQFPIRFYPANINVVPAPVIEPEGDTLTIAEAIEFGLTKASGTYSVNKYKVTGVITEVYNTTYGNMYIADADGNKLTIYGTYDATGEVSYKDMAVKPVAGDTVTIYGSVGQYGGTAQIKNGWIVDHVAVNPPTTEPGTTEPDTTEPSDSSYVKITSAEEFVSGTYVLVAGNGYAPGVVDGTWVTAVQPTVSGNAVTNAAGGVWTLTVSGNSVTLKDANNVFVGTADDDKNNISTGEYAWTWAFAEGKFTFASTGSTLKYFTSNGSTGQYAVGNKFRGYKDTTVNGSHAAEYFYKFDLYLLSEGTGETPTEPTTTEPSTTEPTTTAPTTPTEPAGPDYVTEVEANKAYKLGLNVEDTPWYFNGSTVEGKNYYLAITKNVSEAVDVYLEGVDGGYHLYFMNGDVKTYINIYEYTNNKGNLAGSLELTTTEPTLALVYNEEANTMTGTIGENTYYMGTYYASKNNITYENFSASNLSYITGENASKIDDTQFPAHFYEVSSEPETTEPETTEPETTEPTTTEPTTTEPTATEPASGYVTEVEANKAYKLGVEVENEVWYITGGTGSSAWYLATTKDISAAADIYLEVADGGYVLYFMNGSTKTYIDIYERTDGAAGAGKGSLQLVTEKPSNVLTFDETLATMVLTPDADNSYYLGTYFSTSANKVYDTLSVSNASYITGEGAANIGVTQFVSHLYVASGASTPDATEPATSEPQETEPGAGEPETTAPSETPAGGSADFNTITTSETSGGDAKYTNTYTTTNGWTTVNSAIQVGGVSDANPAFTVVGPDKTHKAVCLNGKVGAAGELTSPTLTGGISKLTLTYTKMFTDTKLSVTITVTDLATGTASTHTVARDVAKNDDKYVVWTDEWTLETPITGDFTIEVVNDCPSGSTSSNKDRLTILSLVWEGAA